MAPGKSHSALTKPKIDIQSKGEENSRHEKNENGTPDEGPAEGDTVGCLLVRHVGF